MKMESTQQSSICFCAGTQGISCFIVNVGSWVLPNVDSGAGIRQTREREKPPRAEQTTWSLQL